MQDFKLRCRALQSRTRTVAKRGQSLSLRLQELRFHRDGFVRWNSPSDFLALQPSIQGDEEGDIPTAVEFLI